MLLHIVWILCKTNSCTLHDEVAGKKMSNFNFTWNLGEQLVLPEIQQRYQEKRANWKRDFGESVPCSRNSLRGAYDSQTRSSRQGTLCLLLGGVEGTPTISKQMGCLE